MFLSERISNKIEELIDEGKIFRAGFIGGFTDTALVMGLGFVAYGYLTWAKLGYDFLKQSGKKA